MSYDFWRGEKIRLRAVDQKDLDAISSEKEEPDSWLERADNRIEFPSWL
jgi:hypothetical protein